MLGIIADDFTGATDVATMLRRSGHRVAVVIEDGTLSADQLETLDAVVVALKSRSALKNEAIAASLDALQRLRAWGAQRFFVKYCSTFDSTADGNIGPVLDAVAAELGTPHCIVVPSLPANHRTVYHGHLFVGPDLLENSPMRHHPLTPMTRSRVAELLTAQTTHPVTEIFRETVRDGPASLRAALDATNARYVVIDAIDDDDLSTIGAATMDHPLVSGGSGLALGIQGPGGTGPSWTSPPVGRGAVLCGSVSRATLAQIDHAAQTQPVRMIDMSAAIADIEGTVADLALWVAEQSPKSTPVVCAARERSDVQAHLNGTETAPFIERVLTGVAAALVTQGTISGLIVAGGETSGAVVRGLQIDSLQIGPEIAPGVCWSAADASGQTIALALKSGNFGADHLFTTAWELLS